jgi:hypothetical protein
MQYYWIKLSPIVQDSPLLALSLGLVSVPVWLIILSDQLKIAGLVGLYPTNYLIFHKLILKRQYVFMYYLIFLILK